MNKPHDPDNESLLKRIQALEALAKTGDSDAKLRLRTLNEQPQSLDELNANDFYVFSPPPQEQDDVLWEIICLQQDLRRRLMHMSNAPYITIMSTDKQTPKWPVESSSIRKGKVDTSKVVHEFHSLFRSLFQYMIHR